MHTVLKIYLSRGSRADFCPLGPDFCGRWAHSPPVQLFCDTLGFSSDAFSPSNWLPGNQQQSQNPRQKEGSSVTVDETFLKDTTLSLTQPC